MPSPLAQRRIYTYVRGHELQRFPTSILLPTLGNDGRDLTWHRLETLAKVRSSFDAAVAFNESLPCSSDSWGGRKDGLVGEEEEGEEGLEMNIVVWVCEKVTDTEGRHGS